MVKHIHEPLPLPAWVFLIGVAVLPFVFWPAATIPFEVPKVYATLLFVMLLGILVATSSTLIAKARLNTPLIVSLALFGLVAILASILGVNFSHSLLGNSYRIDGLITLSALIALGLCTGYVSTPRLQHLFPIAIWAGAFLLSVLTITSYFLAHVFHLTQIQTWGGAVGLTFGQPNFLAGYLLLMLPFGWYIRGHYPRYQRLSSLGLILVTIAIAVTYSWGALGGVVLFASFLAAKKYLVHPQRTWVALTIFAIIGFVGVSLAKDYRSFVPESRYRIYTYVSQATLQRPLLGFGVANIDSAFTSIARKDNYQHDVYVDKAHGELLETLATTGMIGLGLYLLIVFQVGKCFAVSPTSLWKETLLFTLLLFVYHSQTNVISISELTIFWVLIGLALRKN